MNGHNGTTQTFNFSVIPLDCCPRCKQYDGERLGIGMPVAVAEANGYRVVSNVCPSCRLIWDTSWNVAGDRSYGPFEDMFIRSSAGVESRPQGGSVFPAGPRHLLEQRPA